MVVITRVELRIGAIDDLLLSLNSDNNGRQFPEFQDHEDDGDDGDDDGDDEDADTFQVDSKREEYILNRLSGSSVVLPSPLEMAAFSVIRHGRTYTAYIQIACEKGSRFPRLSQRMGQKYRKDWQPIRPREGSGLLTVRKVDGKIKTSTTLAVSRYAPTTLAVSRYDILDSSASNFGDCGYYVAIGGFGAQEVYFNKETFLNEMTALGKVASDVSTICLREAWRERELKSAGKRGVKVESRDLILQLSF